MEFLYLEKSAARSLAEELFVFMRGALKPLVLYGLCVLIHQASERFKSKTIKYALNIAFAVFACGYLPVIF